MAKKTISLSIDDATYQQIAAIFGADDNAAKDSCTKFAQLAFETFAEWITGQTRFRSLTEQHIAWVEALYEALLPAGEVPTVERLYNGFNMTHGQAAYISRVLGEKNLPRWRQQATKEVKDALKKKKEVAQKWVADDNAVKECEVRLSKLAGRELLRLAEQVCRDDDKLQLPKLRSKGTDLAAVAVPAGTLLKLLEHSALS